MHKGQLEKLQWLKKRIDVNQIRINLHQMSSPHTSFVELVWPKIETNQEKQTFILKAKAQKSINPIKQNRKYFGLR